MQRGWVSLSPHYRLEDVQASLNVVVSLLSFLASFVFVRYCWQCAANRVANGDAIPLHSLLSLNTIGEVADVIYLLNRSLFSRRYISTAAQCSVVVIFSTTALLSGPITRFSTRQEPVAIDQPVSGLLASIDNGGSEFANIDWAKTYDRLEQAKFPIDQLMDFLPNTTTDWIFAPANWNNSWSFECEFTSTTPLQLRTTNNCTSFYSELLGLEDAFNTSMWKAWGVDIDGFQLNNTMKDNLLFVYGANWIIDETKGIAKSMTMSLASVHIHDFCLSAFYPHLCNCVPNRTTSALYTKIDCELTRNAEVEDDGFTALPYSFGPSVTFVPEAYLQYYFSRFYSESASDSTITQITPYELARFYQVYTVTKDVQFRYPVTRRLTVNVEVVQISTIAIFVVSVVTSLIILGLSSLGLFAIRHRNVMLTTPLSKVDWMMQSIEAEDRMLEGRKGCARRSVTVDSIAHLSSMPYTRQRKGEFETARYGGRETPTSFWGSPRSPSPYTHTGSTLDDDDRTPSPHSLWSGRTRVSSRETMRNVRYTQMK